MQFDQPARWEVSQHRILAQGRVASFAEDEVLTPERVTMRRQYLTHPGAVAVVAWDEGNDRIACVRQYRHPVGMKLVEIPAGLLDTPGETWAQAARRELAEEAELACDRLQVLADVCTTPGSSQETLRIFLARELRPTARPEGFELKDEEADLEVAWFQRSQLIEGIYSGQLQNPSLVTGVLALEVARASGSLEELRSHDAPWPIREH